MVVIKYICLTLTIILAAGLVANIAMGKTEGLIGGIVIVAIMVFITYRADKDVKKKVMPKN